MKRHIISALITFVTAFAFTLLPHVDTISLESIKDGSVVGILFVALRAGIKGLLEMFLATNVDVQEKPMGKIIGVRKAKKKK